MNRHQSGEVEGDFTDRRDSGAAMIFVLIWSVVLLGLVLVVSQVVVRQIVPSDRSEDSFAALAAAEAGIEDFLVRLEQPGYENFLDPTNRAYREFVDLPGGLGGAQFSYAIDTSRTATAGEIRIYSTGRSGEVSRTVEAVLSRRSTLDYTYLSDIETPAPNVPGAYSSNRDSGGRAGLTSRELAESLCSRRWYESGSVDPSGSTGNQRNLNYCQWAGIYSSERISGRIHTNDVWRLQNTNLREAIEPGAISSSCRSEKEGLAPGEVGCPAERRYLTTSEPLNTNSILGATWNSRTRFQGNGFGPGGGVDITGRNPRYEPVLELPNSGTAAAELKARASEGGCIFTGPTRLRFDVVGGKGVVYVTSPSTKLTGDNCGGTLQSSSVPHTTGIIELADFEDLLIYVQDVPAPGVDDPNNDFDTSNAWPLGSEPTCQPKVGNPSPRSNIYPFVVPSEPGERAGFFSRSAPAGFPSYYADVNSPWYGSNCARGDAYVEGEVLGRVTIATESNVVLTSSLRDSTASLVSGAGYGKPSGSSQSVIGTVAGEFAYLYRPTTSGGSWVSDWRESNANDPILNVALLAVDACFAAQDPSLESRNGFIYLWGSISQKYRCIVGFRGGYSKSYQYDERMQWLAPPYLVNLFGEPWEVRRRGEVNTREQSVGVSNYEVSQEEASNAVVEDPRVVFGSATVTTDGASVSVSTSQPGRVLVRYSLRTPEGLQYRRILIDAA